MGGLPHARELLEGHEREARADGARALPAGAAPGLLEPLGDDALPALPGAQHAAVRRALGDREGEERGAQRGAQRLGLSAGGGSQWCTLPVATSMSHKQLDIFSHRFTK